MISKLHTCVIVFVLLFYSKYLTYCIDAEFNSLDDKKSSDFEESYSQGDDILINKFNDLSNKIKGAFLKSREKDFFDTRGENRREILEEELIYLNQLRNAYDGKGTIPSVDPLSPTMDLGYSEHPFIMSQQWTEWSNCIGSCGETGTRVRSLVCRMSSRQDNDKCYGEEEVMKRESEKCTSECLLAASDNLMSKERMFFLGVIFWAMVLLIVIIAIICLKKILPAKPHFSDTDSRKHIKFESMTSLLPRDNINENRWKGFSSQIFSNNNSALVSDQLDEHDLDKIVRETRDILKKADKLNLDSNTRVINMDNQSENQSLMGDEHDNPSFKTLHEEISLLSSTSALIKQNNNQNKCRKITNVEHLLSQCHNSAGEERLLSYDSLPHQCSIENKFMQKVETSSDFSKSQENCWIMSETSKPTLILQPNEDSRCFKNVFDEEYYHNEDKIYPKNFSERNFNENNSILSNETNEMVNITDYQSPISVSTNHLLGHELLRNSSPQHEDELETRFCNDLDSQNLTQLNKPMKLECDINH